MFFLSGLVAVDDSILINIILVYLQKIFIGPNNYIETIHKYSV